MKKFSEEINFLLLSTFFGNLLNFGYAVMLSSSTMLPSSIVFINLELWFSLWPFILNFWKSVLFFIKIKLVIRMNRYSLLYKFSTPQKYLHIHEEISAMKRIKIKDVNEAFKGQLILKAIYGLLTSPKKWTDEFVFLAFFTLHSKQIKFVCLFFVRIYASQSTFWFYPSFNCAVSPWVFWRNSQTRNNSVYWINMGSIWVRTGNTWVLPLDHLGIDIR